MKEDRYPAASAAQTMPDMSNMTELEKKSALRRLQKERVKSGSSSKPDRMQPIPAKKQDARPISTQTAPVQASQQSPKTNRPTAKKKKRRSLLYALYAALMIEIQQAKKSSRKTAAKETPRRKPSAVPAVEEKKPQQMPVQPVIEEKKPQVTVPSVVVVEKTQMPVQPVVAEENPIQPVAAEEKQASAQPAVADKPKQSDKKTWITAALIFCSIMLATLGFLGVRSATAANDFRELSQQVREKEEELSTSEPVEYVTQATDPVPEDEIESETVPEETQPAVKTILPKYADLVVENPELFGWVRIDDTVLDYPVMRSTMDNEKYLYANFAGKYSFAGTPFADNQCSADSDNLVIYGHNIKDGSMFRSLFKYEKESYWQEHPTIMYSDLYDDYEYEVMAVFYDQVYKKTDNVFKFYQFIDAENKEDFDYAISQFKEKSLYDTGVDAQYGDKLITLVTCSYQVENGRFVVVARRK